MAPRIAGVASTRYGKHPESSTRQLFLDAATAALDDADLTADELDGVLVGNFIGDITDDQAHVGAMLADFIGVPAVGSARIESACASAAAAASAGRRMILADEADAVLVGGVEMMYQAGIQRVTDALANAADNEYENEVGLTFPGIYALMARAYLDRHDISQAELAEVAVKARRNGVKNPIAQVQKETTVDDVLESPMIASPLNLQDCCPITDGASAAVLVSQGLADERDLDAPVEFISTGHAGDSLALHDRRDLTSLPAGRRAAEAAYARADIGPDDIDIAEVHDCFTIAELFAIEALGFAEMGTGMAATMDGVTAIDGQTPVNPSGGLLAKGHPVGATGVGQLVEVTKQLERRHPNQVADPEIGLTHTIGGSGASCLVNIFRRR